MEQPSGVPAEEAREHTVGLAGTGSECLFMLCLLPAGTLLMGGVQPLPASLSIHLLSCVRPGNRGQDTGKERTWGSLPLN